MHLNSICLREAIAAMLVVTVSTTERLARAEPPPPTRTIPFIDTSYQERPKEGPELERRKAREEIEGKMGAVAAELGRAKRSGQPTQEIEARLQALEAQRSELKEPEKIDTQKLPWPELRSKLAEIRRLARSDEPLSLADAQTLIDMLYVDVDPHLNMNLQHATLNGIKNCTEENLLTEEVRQFLRNGTIEYFRAARTQSDGIKAGPLCAPFSVTFMSEAIAAVASAGDDEAIKCLGQLHDRMVELGEALEFSSKKTAGYLQLVDEARASITLETSEAAAVTALAGQELSDEDIGKTLRLYRRILRAPAQRVGAATVATIDANLLRLGQLELSKANWPLWRDAAIALGPTRASKTLTEFVAANVESGEKAKGAVFKRVNQIYSRRAD